MYRCHLQESPTMTTPHSPFGDDTADPGEYWQKPKVVGRAWTYRSHSLSLMRLSFHGNLGKFRVNQSLAFAPLDSDHISWSYGAMVFPNRIIFGSFIGKKPSFNWFRKPLFRPRKDIISVEAGEKYCVKLSSFASLARWWDVQFGMIKFGLNCKALNFKPVDGDMNLRKRKDFDRACNHDDDDDDDDDDDIGDTSPARDDRTTELIPSAATIKAPV